MIVNSFFPPNDIIRTCNRLTWCISVHKNFVVLLC